MDERGVVPDRCPGCGVEGYPWPLPCLACGTMGPEPVAIRPLTRQARCKGIEDAILARFGISFVALLVLAVFVVAVASDGAISAADWEAMHAD